MFTLIAPLALGATLAALPPPQAQKPGTSPVGVVRAFYKAANAGQCVQAKRHLAPEALDALQRRPGGYDRFCADRAGDAPLSKVSIKGAQIRDAEAEVVSERHFAGGKVAGETLRLVKRGGEWRIALPSGRGAP